MTSSRRIGTTLAVIFLIAVAYAALIVEARSKCELEGKNARLEVFLRNQEGRSKDLGERAIAPYRFPVATAQRGTLLLQKAKTVAAFSLEVSRHGQVTRQLDLINNPWEISWNPSGSAVSFLIESTKPGIYELCVWWIDNNAVVTANAPGSRSAAFPVRWSPNGRYVGYINYDRGRSQLIILEVRHRSFRSTAVLDNIEPKSGFAWSADSGRVAFTRESGQIASIEIFNLRSFRTHTLIPTIGGAISGLAWAPSFRELAMASRQGVDQHYGLRVVTTGGKLRDCPTAIGDVESPVWLSGGRDIAYLLEQEGKQSLYLSHDCKRSSLLARPSSGAARLQDDGYNHVFVPFIEAQVDEPPKLHVAIPLLANTQGRESAKRREEPSPEQIWLTGSGPPTPAWLWRGIAGETKSQAVIFVHGGPHLSESGEWEPLRSALVKGGATILALNYAGSVGYGKAFEDSTDLDVEAKELARAVAYAANFTKTKSTDVTIIASSYGTRVLLRALQHDPSLCRLIVFSPFLATPLDVDNGRGTPFTGVVLAFHGKNDAISSPRFALRSLQAIFPLASKAGKLYWKQFDGEGHGFTRIASLQEQYGTISCAIYLSACMDYHGHDSW